MQAVEEFQQRLLQVKNGCLWSERGTGKSYGLARVALERHTGQPIVVVGAGMRQANIVKMYIRQLCDTNGIKEPLVFSVPVSSLEQMLKGMATDCLVLADEFQCIPQDLQRVITKCKNWVAVASND